MFQAPRTLIKVLLACPENLDPKYWEEIVFLNVVDQTTEASHSPLRTAGQLPCGRDHARDNWIRDAQILLWNVASCSVETDTVWKPETNPAQFTVLGADLDREWGWDTAGTKGPVGVWHSHWLSLLVNRGFAQIQQRNAATCRQTRPENQRQNPHSTLYHGGCRCGCWDPDPVRGLSWLLY